LKWLFTFEGRVGRGEYFVAAVVLSVLKFAIDWTVAGSFRSRFSAWSYYLPALSGVHAGRAMYVAMCAIAIPFAWIGITLTLRRLRDAGRPLWFTFLFFVPFVNLGMFLWLSLDAGRVEADEGELQGGVSPEDSWDAGEAVIATVVGSALGLLLVVFGTRYLLTYAWGLFLGVPFVVGFCSSLLLNLRSLKTEAATVWISMGTVGVIGVGMLALSFEGMICLLMALPLALPFAIGGALVARSILKGGRLRAAPGAFTTCVVVLPAMMVGEHTARIEPSVNAVTTSIVINAPVDVVWKNVISFPPLAPPKEAIFKAGVAYPIAGDIVGSGVGAVRHCRFSTGEFVEPITTWDENRMLAFNVTSQPPSLRELSPWEIVPPHIERNYMRSQHGQFRLVALDSHRTLLEGTTWYQNYLWPQVYWREWSDGIVHTIHMRVLQHVKTQAEKH
jgi:uncharacterized membrane protein YhaH (DUF805 family)